MQRRRFKVVLSIAGGVLLVGAVAGVLLFVSLRHVGSGSGSKAVATAKAYLADVGAGRYSEAYARLCPNPNVGTLSDFTARMMRARATGHVPGNYQLHVTFTNETLKLTSAAGRATYADGTDDSVLYDLATADGLPCLVTYDSFST
jgi:hypothetical protein